MVLQPKKFLFQSLKKSKGFTLIELLVVVAIIGLLASIVLVSLKEVIEKAKTARALQFSSTIFHSLGVDLIGYWPFDSKTGNITKDISGNGADGTLRGAVDITSGNQGIAREALYFPGEWGDVAVDENKKLNSESGSLTIEAWVKTTTGFVSYIVLKQGAYLLDIVPALGYPVLFRIYYDGNFCSVSIAGSLRLNKWNHLAGTFDKASSTLKLYIDGKEVDVTSFCNLSKKGVTKNDNSVYLGYDPSGTGMIDEIRIYDASLTSAQIKKLYVEGAEKKGLLVQE